MKFLFLMPAVITFGIIPLLSTALAGTLSLQCTSNGLVTLLERDSCLNSKEVVSGLSLFDKSLGLGLHEGFIDSPFIETNASSTLINENCETDLTPHLSQKIKDLVCKKSRNGPNCFNTTLFLSGLVASKTYSDDKEFGYWIGSEACRLIGDEETSLPGDIRVFKNGEKIIHATTQLYGEVVIDKPGWQGWERVEIKKISEVLEFWKVPVSETYRCRAPFWNSSRASKKLDKLQTSIEAHLWEQKPLLITTKQIQNLKKKYKKSMPVYLVERANNLEQQISLSVEESQKYRAFTFGLF